MVVTPLVSVVMLVTPLVPIIMTVTPLSNASYGTSVSSNALRLSLLQAIVA